LKYLSCDLEDISGTVELGSEVCGDSYASGTTKGQTVNVEFRLLELRVHLWACTSFLMGSNCRKLCFDYSVFKARIAASQGSWVSLYTGLMDCGPLQTLSYHK